MTQRRRTCRITVGTLRASMPLRLAFEIERTVHSHPAKAVVRLTNLTRDHQAQIEGAAAAQVIVEAGYEDDPRGLEQIFRGELYRARGGTAGPAIRTDRDAVSATTIVEARDAGGAYQAARVSQSWEPGVRVSTVLRACVDALGVGPGNVADVADLASLEAGGDTYPEGTALAGSASRELRRILGGLGLTYTVQHGALQIVRRGAAAQTQAALLSSSTGLVGRPERLARGRVKVVSLLTSAIWPGRPVVLRSEHLQGRYIAQKCVYRGDTHGQDFYVEAELATEAA